jgi:DNA-directed RNA polymerase subunit alpha
MKEPFFSITCEKETKSFGKYVIEPLPQGFGHTLGNGLRRVLLTFISGTALSFVKINGITHQFSTIKGLKEDVVSFIFNLKSIQFRLEGQEEVKLTLERNGEGEIKAKDIKLPANVTIANPDQYLGYLSGKGAKLDVTLWIENGEGYKPSEERKSSELGIIPVDSFFSPVQRVNFTVEETRVGRATNFDKLTLEIWTNEAVNPKQALEQAATILVSYFDHLLHPSEVVKPTSDTAKRINQAVLEQTVEELDLAVRVTNALKKGGYEKVADFSGKTRSDLKQVRNLGDKSIELIVTKLQEKGVEIGQ